eukprot:s658_g23.t1
MDCGQRPEATDIAQDPALICAKSKVAEAIEKALELMQASATKPTPMGDRPSSFGYAKIAHLVLLLCQSELSSEVPRAEPQLITEQGLSDRRTARTDLRTRQHMLITNAIGHLTDMLDTSSVVDERLPADMRPPAKVAKALLVQLQEQAITVYALRDGDINMDHLLRYQYHQDVPYYTLEFVLVWPMTLGLEHLYCKHFCTG